MKFTLLATTALAFIAAAALAQTYDVQGDKSGMTIARGRIDSGTTVTDQTIFDTRSDVWAGFRCGTGGSVTIVQKLADGTVVQSSASQICDTTQRWVSATGPVPAQTISISPTTAVSTTTGGISATILQTAPKK